MGCKYVLVIDDDLPFLDLLSRYLDMFSFPALTAIDGPTALALLDEHAGDVGLILLDIALPQMNGYQIFRAIRDDPRSVDIPVIAVTALGHIVHTRILEAGMDGFIVKPFSPDDLERTLREFNLLPQEELGDGLEQQPR